ncbi:MAG: hypothetical protein ACSLEN_07370 [Candidatus Malihini olakiniferum]
MAKPIVVTEESTVAEARKLRRKRLSGSQWIPARARYFSSSRCDLPWLKRHRQQ